MAKNSLAIYQIDQQDLHTSQLVQFDQRKRGLGSRHPLVCVCSSPRCADHGVSESSPACFLVPLADDASFHQYPPPNLPAMARTMAGSSQQHPHPLHEVSEEGAYLEAQELRWMAPLCHSELQRRHPWHSTCARSRRDASVQLEHLPVDPHLLQWIFSALEAILAF